MAVDWERLAASPDWKEFWTCEDIQKKTVGYLDDLLTSNDPDVLGRARGALAAYWELERFPVQKLNEKQRAAGWPSLANLLRATWLQRLWSWQAKRSRGLPSLLTTPTPSRRV